MLSIALHTVLSVALAIWLIVSLACRFSVSLALTHVGSLFLMHTGSDACTAARNGWWEQAVQALHKAALNEHESEMLVHVLGDLRFICRQPAAASSAVLGGLVPMLVELCQRPPGEVPELAMAVLRNCTGPADDCSIAGDGSTNPKL